MTLIKRPFPRHLRPASLGRMRNMGIHRAACVGIFILMLLAAILHYLPGVVYTLQTKRGAPSTGLPSWLHVASVLASVLAAGFMRRGPLLCAEIAVSTFGLSGVEARQNGKPDNGKDGELWDEKKKPEVIDYGNSSMIKFLALGYVSFVVSHIADESESPGCREEHHAGRAPAKGPAPPRGVGPDERRRVSPHPGAEGRPFQAVQQRAARGGPVEESRLVDHSK